MYFCLPFISSNVSKNPASKISSKFQERLMESDIRRQFHSAFAQMDIGRSLRAEFWLSATRE